MMKKCSKCSEVKLVEEFPQRGTWCKICYNAYQKVWASKNKEKSKKSSKDWYLKNREKALQTSQEWKDKNKDRADQLNREWYQENKEYLAELQRVYTKKNKEKISETRKKYRKLQRKSPEYRVVENLRSRVRYAVQKAVKMHSTLKLLGCSPKELIEYLEKQFRDGMTWDNYGKDGWEIDHIRPCASFDMTKEEEQKACFHYSNLQPLWEEENRVKKDKFKEKDNNEKV